MLNFGSYIDFIHWYAEQRSGDYSLDVVDLRASALDGRLRYTGRVISDLAPPEAFLVTEPWPVDVQFSPPLVAAGLLCFKSGLDKVAEAISSLAPSPSAPLPFSPVA